MRFELIYIWKACSVYWAGFRKTRIRLNVISAEELSCLFSEVRRYLPIEGCLGFLRLKIHVIRWSADSLLLAFDSQLIIIRQQTIAEM